MAEPVNQQAMFVDGPTRGNKYNSRYLVDESFYMYKRKFKSGDTQFGPGPEVAGGDDSGSKQKYFFCSNDFHRGGWQRSLARDCA